MGCNTSKDGSNPSQQTSNAPTTRAEEGPDNNTKQSNDEAFMTIPNEEIGSSQNEQTEVNNDESQLIINEDTENKSGKNKDAKPDHQQVTTPVGEEENSTQDGGNNQDNVDQIQLNEKSPSSHGKVEGGGGGGDQGADDTNKDEQAPAQEQNLDDV